MSSQKLQKPTTTKPTPIPTPTPNPIPTPIPNPTPEPEATPKSTRQEPIPEVTRPEPTSEPTLTPEPIPKSKGKDPEVQSSDVKPNPTKEFIQAEQERLKRFRKPLNAEILNASRYAAVDAKVYLILPNFANEYNVTSEENDRFSAHRLAREDAFTSIPIKRISEVKHVPFEKTKIIYSIYEVIREDNKKQYFCDNDLLSINPQDLIPLGQRMMSKMNEKKDPQDKVAFNRILRCIESFIKFMKQTDFETGIKYGETFLRISAPNEDREGMEHLPVGTIITKPEVGVVFRRPGKRCFFRLSEVKKYSTEVIEIVQSYASIQKDQGKPEDEVKITAEKIYQRTVGALKLRKLVEEFLKIVNRAPDARF